MRAAGYVLVGGRSRRMGTDKALLPWGTGILLDRVAGEVRTAAGDVTLVGDPAKYSNYGYPVIGDRMPGNGPLSGVVAALSHSPADWSLIVACDMPNLTAEFLTSLLDAAFSSTVQIDCVAPQTEAGPEPLCALYHQRALPLLNSFLEHKFLKMQDAVRDLRTQYLPFTGTPWFRNLNTPEDLQTHE
jgi:molybdenum cofactor guanylyltransferase